MVFSHRRQKFRRRIRLFDGHQLAALERIGRVQRNDQAIDVSFGRETADARHDADGRDRDGLAADGHAARFGEDLRRLNHVVVVEHRLAHAHENDAANGMRRVVVDLDDLIDDFPRGQIAAEAHPAGGAELAAHRAAHLRTDADDVLEVVGPVQQRNAHRLERFRAVAAKEVLGESVARRDLFLDQRQVGDRRVPAHLVAAAWRRCLRWSMGSEPRRTAAA